MTKPFFEIVLLSEYIINKNKNIYLFIITIYRCMYIYSYRDKRTIGQNMKKWLKQWSLEHKALLIP